MEDAGTVDGFARYYAALADDELQRIVMDAGNLAPNASIALQQETSRRGLYRPDTADNAVPPATTEPTNTGRLRRFFHNLIVLLGCDVVLFITTVLLLVSVLRNVDPEAAGEVVSSLCLRLSLLAAVWTSESPIKTRTLLVYGLLGQPAMIALFVLAPFRIGEIVMGILWLWTIWKIWVIWRGKKRTVARSGGVIAAVCIMAIGATCAAQIEESFTALQQRAKAGSSEAQEALAQRYLSGDGVKPNAPEAIIWFKKSAEQRNERAEGMLATLYKFGFEGSIPINMVAAFHWDEKLAEEGNPKYQLAVAAAYGSGRGVARDDVKAARWMRTAADQNEPFAQYALGAMYENGTGLPQSKSEAAKWYEKAALHNIAGAQYRLGLLYAMGGGVKSDPDAAYFWLNVSAATDPEARQPRDSIGHTLDPSERDEIEKSCVQWFASHPLPQDELDAWLKSKEVKGKQP